MQSRLDRASRRFERMEPLLTKRKQKEPDPALEAAETQSVGDDFSHALSEMKNIIHYFKEWCDEVGPKGSGGMRLKAWQATLSPDEQTTMITLIEARNCDVHREPVEPRRSPTVLLIPSPQGGLLLLTSPDVFIARFEFKDGRSGSLQVKSFCGSAFPLLRRLVDEFDRL